MGHSISPILLDLCVDHLHKKDLYTKDNLLAQSVCCFLCSEVPLFDVPIDFDKNQLKVLEITRSISCLLINLTQNQKSFMKSYYQKASSDENQDLRLNLHPNLQYFTSFSITCYEATFTIAKALKMTLEGMWNLLHF